VNSGTVNADTNVFYHNTANGAVDDCESCTTNTSKVIGDPKLATLGNYGGPTQTMIPLPGSAAICAGAVSDIPSGTTTDQRGTSRTTIYNSTRCVDTGTVQTNYSVSFATPFPVSGTTYSALSPSPVVWLYESGSAFALSGTSISISDSAAHLSSSTSTLTAPTDSSGQAAFTHLVFTAAESSDTLVALVSTHGNSTVATSNSFTITDMTLSPTAGALTAGTVGVAYNASQTQTFTAASGAGSYAYTVASGSLPTGLTLSAAGVLSGTPTAIGSYSFDVMVAENNHSVTQNYTLAIQANTPALLAVSSGNYQLTHLSTAFTNALVVKVSDANGYPVPSQSVTFTAPSSGASLLFSNSANSITAVTDAAGTATVSAPTANATAGSYTVTASLGTLSAGFSLFNQAMPTYTVTTLTDDASGVAANCSDQSLKYAMLDNACSLRDAITAAASATLTPTINFSVTRLGLSSSSLSKYSATGPLTISGNMNIVGPGANLLSIDGGNYQVFAVSSGVTANLSGLTIANGFGASAGNGTGGGIYNAGALTVSNSTFSGNSALMGGGIFNTGTLTMSNCTFSKNSAVYNGGGILNAGTSEVSSSTFSGNSTTYQYGGGIYNYRSLTVNNSIFSGNSASNSSGGGIYNYAANTGASVKADSNLFYNNLDSNKAESDCENCTANGGSNSNVVSGDRKLAALANYGGATQTMIPLPGSAAICAVSDTNAVTAGITSDQRGVSMSGLSSSTESTYTGAGGYCPQGYIDAGAVQTTYALSFTAAQSVEPTESVLASTAFSPAPAVTLLESGAPFADGTHAISVGVTLQQAKGGTAKLSASSAATDAVGTDAKAGVATFTDLSVSAVGVGDYLQATVLFTTMPLYGPLTLTASSTSFSVISTASLSIAASHSSPNSSTAPIFQSGPAILTLTVTNSNGQATFGKATVSDTVDAAFIINSVSSGCSVSGQVVTCTIPQGSTAASTSFNIFVTVTGSAGGSGGGSISNTATLTDNADFIAAGSVTDSIPVTAAAPQMDSRLSQYILSGSTDEGTCDATHRTFSAAAVLKNIGGSARPIPMQRTSQSPLQAIR